MFYVPHDRRLRARGNYWIPAGDDYSFLMPTDMMHGYGVATERGLFPTGQGTPFTPAQQAYMYEQARMGGVPMYFGNPRPSRRVGRWGHIGY